jgi:hypothetical protein
VDMINVGRRIPRPGRNEQILHSRSGTQRLVTKSINHSLQKTGVPLTSAKPSATGRGALILVAQVME